MYKKIIYTFLIVSVLGYPLLYAQPMYKNLVFEGGGIRGIANTGAMQALEEKYVTDSIERVAGTSVGSIVAMLVAVGYTAGEMKDISFRT